MNGFKIHGTEAAGAPPLFQAQEIDIGLRVLPLVTGKKLELDSLTIKQPQVNVIVYPDGTTNIPHPQSILPPGVTAKNASGPSKSPLQTVMDLAIGHFNIENGTIQFADRKIPLTARGENLRAQFSYQQSAMQYQGEISISPLFIQDGSNPRLNVQVQAPVVVASDKIQIANATVATPDSNLKISAKVTNLAMPQVTARVSGQVDLLEVKRTLGLSAPLNTAPGVPHVLLVNAALNVPSEGSRVTTLDLGLGQSHFQAHGMFVSVAPAQGSLQFNSSFSLPELGRLLQIPYQTAGTVQLAGNASLNGISHYSVQAALNGQKLGFQRGNLQIENAALTSRILADPQKIQAEPIHLAVAGGQFNG
ncbi:MAG: AsmA family protein, partial [Terriglobia bacterium]